MTRAILASLAPVFLVMALGYVACRTKQFDNHKIDSLNDLVMDFAATMRKVGAVALVASACSTSAAFAIDLVTRASQEQSSGTSASLQSWQSAEELQSYIFGDWGGLRTWLSNHGIDLFLSYRSESAWDVAGGMARGGTYAGGENLRLDVDWEKIANLNGFSTHVDFVSRQGRNVSTAYVGDVLLQSQEVYGSPTAERDFIYLGSFYLEQKLFNGNVDLRAGRIPVFSDFGTLPDACDFMSNSICGNPSLTTNLGWTSFPAANWGAVAEFKISGPLSLKIGGYEVNQNDGGTYGFGWALNGAIGAIVPVELDWNVKLGPQQLPGIFKIGGSYDTSPYPEWYTAVNGLPLPLTTTPQAQRGTFYVLAHQQIWQPDTHSDRGLTVLAGYDYNTPNVSLFENYAFVGLVDKGPLPWRPDDRAGFEVAYGRVSPFLTRVQTLQAALGLPFSNSAPGVETYEIILEANYNIKLYPGIYLMPDAQYVIRPSAASTYPNALVVGFRVNAIF
jgi:porin